ncbi:hypothetical protein EV174_002511 [Coemansia sp. RSA 2320]|nr:hypothetical protein EV174_002511 [Coemansia sp. RSA 2320]
MRQDDAKVYITIHAPHIRAQTIEFDVDDDQFKFHAAPYYLRLTFPGKVVEDEGSSASLDATTGDISVILSKETPGQAFENLDLLTSLLATRRERDLGMAGAEADRSQPPLIEDIGGCTSEEQLAILQDEDFDWEISQTPTLPLEDESVLLAKTTYGFNQQYSGLLAHASESGNDINGVPDSEHMSLEQRRAYRVASEDAKFDESYYMDNYINDEDIQPLLRYKTPFFKILRRLQKDKHCEATEALPAAEATLVDDVALREEQTLPTSDASWSEFTDKEKAVMLELPRKSHLISDQQAVYLGLVDIMFAYSLDNRSNLGEPTVESLWAIGAVSSTLSNLEQFSALRPTLVSCFRRALAYPLYRNWDLCEKALEDVYVIFKLGLRAVLKVMLELKHMFDRHDIYYVYSKLCLDDYCVWLQTAARDKAVKSLAHELHHFEVEKDELGWNLEAFEDLALQTSESEDDEADESETADSGVREHDVQEPFIAPPSQPPLIEVLGESSRADALVDQEPASSPSAVQNSSDGASSSKRPLIELLD